MTTQTLSKGKHFKDEAWNFLFSPHLQNCNTSYCNDYQDKLISSHDTPNDTNTMWLAGPCTVNSSRLRPNALFTKSWAFSSINHRVLHGQLKFLTLCCVINFRAFFHNLSQNIPEFLHYNNIKVCDRSQSKIAQLFNHKQFCDKFRTLFLCDLSQTC